MGLFRKLGRGLIKLIDGAITLAVVIAAVAVCAAVATIGFAFVAGIVIGLGSAAPLSIGITAGVFVLGTMITNSGIKNHAGSSVKCKPIFTFPPQQQQQPSQDASNNNIPQQSPGNAFKKAAPKNNAADHVESHAHRLWAQDQRVGNLRAEPAYSTS